MPHGIVEDRRAEHRVRLAHGIAEQAVDEAALAAPMAVVDHAREDRATAFGQLIKAIREDARTLEAVARGSRERGHEVLAEGQAGCGGVPLPRRGRREQGALGTVEHGDGPLERASLGVRSEQRPVEPVVDGEVGHPRGEIGLQRSVAGELPVGIAQTRERGQRIHGRCDPHPAEQLVGMHEQKRQRRLGRLAGTVARAPREIAPELGIRHVLVRGVIALERPRIGTVVLIALHEAGLLVEELRIRVGGHPPAAVARERAHLRDGVRRGRRCLGDELGERTGKLPER